MDDIAVIDYFKENYMHTTVKKAAAHFGYSESHFAREFKKRVGISPQDYLVAIKVQNSVEHLLESENTILHTQLRNGYLSDGSFTNRIKKSMILSPKQLEKKSADIFMSYKYHENDGLDEEDVDQPDVIVNLMAEEAFEGIVFVGLFKKPIPNQPPVIGKAIRKFEGLKRVYFQDVPPGEYYCLACVIHKTYNPLRLFVHKDNLRGRVETVINMPGKYEEILRLRPPLPTDPPITLNLPLMFINILKEKKNEYRAD